MSYALERNEMSELAMLTFVGSVPLEDRDTALAELESLLTETGWRKVLVDLSSSNSSGAMTLQEDLRHAWRLVDLHAKRKDLRIAYVFAPRQPPVLELIAESRGYVFERFGDRHAALGWLDSSTLATKRFGLHHGS
jgi:hypothetical protein